MKSSTMPLLIILTSLLTTPHIAAQPLETRASPTCAELQTFNKNLNETFAYAYDINIITFAVTAEIDLGGDFKHIVDDTNKVGCPNALKIP